MKPKGYDFSGYATRNNIKCADGRTIMPDAFKHNDGKTVPLVWNHQHDDPLDVLGHAILENRKDGVYAYGYLNPDTEPGRAAKAQVAHGDVTDLSIYANHLQQQNNNVIHGSIREVSLVLAGANPGAFIDNVISHGEESDEEAYIFTSDEDKIVINHSDDWEETPEESEDVSHADTTKKEDTQVATETKPAEESGKTVQDVINSMTEEQKTVLYALVGEAADGQLEDTTGGEKTMKHNLFDNETETQENTISHDDMKAVFDDARRNGSLAEAALAHGITDIDFLFPDAKNVTNMPTFIQRDTGWVQKVMAAVKHSPMSRIKSLFANITEDDARAKGYIKGNLKKEEVFTLLKRSTTPTTVYKKQKLDRDDVVDIVDFDVVAWLKSEMRMMLDEEIARAVLVGDGRLSSSDDKINEQNIRPIWKDDLLYTIKVAVDAATANTDQLRAKEFIRQVVKSRKQYKGSGSPSLYTTEDVLTDCLLLEDGMGRVIYETVDKLATALRVKEIITVPVMENQVRTEGSFTYELMGLIVNLNDYTVGADKGGAVNMFDDFDIDYNQQKYLIETRCSGALTVPYSAIAVEKKTAVNP